MRPPRLKQFDYLGPHRYSLTIVSFQRRTLFVQRTIAETVVQQIWQSAGRFAFAVLAYCIMPDHLHLLVQGNAENSHLPTYVAHFKQRAAQKTRKHCDRLWQPGYFDRVLREEEDTPSVTQYILWNPVRAGLVSKPEEYPYSFSAMGWRK